ncbi:MAG: hypothetical protein AB3N16_15125 [Flavobacteriaceae bacterium]
MSKQFSERFSPQQQKELLAAIQTFTAHTDTDSVLANITKMFFMSQEHFLLDNPDIRNSVSLSYTALHDLISVVDKVARNQEYCYQLPY